MCFAKIVLLAKLYYPNLNFPEEISPTRPYILRTCRWWILSILILNQLSQDVDPNTVPSQKPTWRLKIDRLKTNLSLGCWKISGVSSKERNCSYDNAVTVEQLDQRSVFLQIKAWLKRQGRLISIKKKQLQVSSYLGRKLGSPVHRWFISLFISVYWILEGSDTLGGSRYAFHVLSPDFWTNRNPLLTSKKWQISFWSVRKLFKQNSLLLSSEIEAEETTMKHEKRNFAGVRFWMTGKKHPRHIPTKWWCFMVINIHIPM